MASRETLLDALVRLTKCAFLSDLHLAGNRDKVVRALCSLCPEAYSQEEWRDAACYLCGPPTAPFLQKAAIPRDEREESYGIETNPPGEERRRD